MAKSVINIGDKFGKLTVLGQVKILGKSSERYWKCKCECGGTVEASTTSLRSGDRKTCGHCRENTVIGKKFNKLLVTEIVGRDKKGNLIVKCKCDCGNEIQTQAHKLYSDSKTSCGQCIRYDMVGKRFGSLVVTKFVYVKDEKSWYEAKCDCGNVVVVPGNYMRSGVQKKTSCGKCFHLISDSYKPELHQRCVDLSVAWNRMYNRCRNPKSDSFPLYGGSGVELNIDRLDFVKLFYKDPSYKPDLQIDRINASGNYDQNNIRWSTLEENNKNKLNTYAVDYDTIAKKLMTMMTFSKICAVNNFEPFEFIMVKVEKCSSPSRGKELWLFIHSSLINKSNFYTDRIINNFEKYNGEIDLSSKINWCFDEELI